MILLVVVVLCLASVPLAGGRLGRLADLQLRGLGVVFAALALQFALSRFAADGDHRLEGALHLATYALAGWFLWLNRDLPGLRLIAAGGALNAAAIAANGGVMPASPAALEAAGLAAATGFANSDVVPGARLAALGDVIPVPGPEWIANVLSVGDLTIFAGALVFLHVVCAGTRRRRAAPALTAVRAVTRQAAEAEPSTSSTGVKASPTSAATGA